MVGIKYSGDVNIGGLGRRHLWRIVVCGPMF